MAGGAVSEAERAAMRLALEEAARGAGSTSPNPMVGAAVLRDGAVVATGWHRAAGEPHAERLALRAAGGAARGATVVVTLEPCCHHGRTPPCTDALAEAGVARVVIATLDVNPAVRGRGVATLRARGIDVAVLAPDDPLARQAVELTRAFVHWMQTRRPYTLVKLATTLDGRIATASGESRWITGPEARKAGHRLRLASDAVLVGAETALADDPRLDVRHGLTLDGGLPPRPPTRVVVDSRLRVPSSAKVWRDDGATRVCGTTSAAPAEALAALEAAGVHVWVLDGADGRVDLRALLDRLATLPDRPTTQLLVEGGGTLAASLLDAGLVQELHQFVAPRLLGAAGRPGLGVLAGSDEGRRALADHPLGRVTGWRAVGRDLEIVVRFDERAAGHPSEV